MSEVKDEGLLNDIYSSAKELITERFSSPFIFSFIVSWIIFNYKVVLAIITTVTSEFSIYAKIDLVECLLNLSRIDIFNTGYFILCNGFALPFIAALFYTYGYPYIDYEITKFTLNRKVDIRNERIKAENKIVFSADDVESKLKKHMRIEKDLIEQIQSAELTESRLRKLIETLEGQVKLDTEIKKQKEMLETELMKIQEEYKKAKNRENNDKLSQDELNHQKNKEKVQLEKIISLVDSLDRDSLSTVMYIGRNTIEIKSNEVDESELRNLDDFILSALVKDGILSRRTNPKTLNKAYKLTTLGKSIYEYLIKGS